MTDRIALANTTGSPSIAKGSTDEAPGHMHNPMIAFWKRAVREYDALQGEPKFEDSALIISDLGQSLYMLFGRHWTKDARQRYIDEKSDTDPKWVRDLRKKIERNPNDTPDLTSLVGTIYPRLGYDLPGTDKRLWDLLKCFIDHYYKDLVKHFQYSKFEAALGIKRDDLSRFMEITRLTWRWFMDEVFEHKTNESTYERFEHEYIQQQMQVQSGGITATGVQTDLSAKKGIILVGDEEVRS